VTRQRGERIGVGIIGASVDRGWAAAAHVPALAHLEEYRLAAVATTSQDSARKAADAFDARHAFDDAAALAAHPEVDLVVISVKAPAHAAAIHAALAAGKHVFSEWPLGVDLAEANELAAAAAGAGVVHAIGLQGYHSPSARFARDLIAQGRIGTVESVAMIAAGDPLGGAQILPGLVWSARRLAGNTVLSIMVGHALATLEHVLGTGPAELSATTVRRHDRVTVAGTGTQVDTDAPGHVAVHGRLTGGALLALSVHGGSASTPDGFLIKIAGTGGTMTITPTDPAHYPGWANWRIRLAGDGHDGTDLAVPDQYRTVPATVPPGPAANVAALYREIAGAIREGRPAHPGFDTALRHHRQLAAIETAALTGTRQHITAGTTGPGH
jgi:predicted dehydrogenase